MYGILLIIVVGCGIAFILAFLWSIFFAGREMNREKLKRLGNRPNMTGEEFYNLHYASIGIPKDIVTALLERLSKALEVPPGVLRPTDRFDVEFAPLRGWGGMDDRLDLYNLLGELERESGMKLDSTVATIDDLIRTVAKGRSQAHN
jgi:hypothetical protein